MMKLLVFILLSLVLLCMGGDVLQTGIEQLLSREVYRLTERQRNDPTNRFHDTECATQEYYEAQKKVSEQDVDPRCWNAYCDQPGNAENTSNVYRVVNVAITFVNSNVTEKAIRDVVLDLNKDMLVSNIAFRVVQIQWVSMKFGGSDCIRPIDSNFYVSDINEQKNRFAYGFADGETPSFNWFIGCQQSSPAGGLGGIATFPWMTQAALKTGGLWNAESRIEPFYTTLIHEIGHCLGLWHSFHGVSEVSCTSPCYERAHPWHALSDIQEYNLIGDLAGDTPASPQTFDCFDPPGGDCKVPSTPWSRYGTQPKNIMSYSRFDHDGTRIKCGTIFTPQQSNRMRCYLSTPPLNKWVCTGSNCTATDENTWSNVRLLRFN